MNYHVTPLCSPTRAALLTGLNPHAAGVGSLAVEDHGFPGYRGQILDTVTTAAELFRHNGYGTFAVGKWHLTPRSAMSDAGNRASWPLQRGFDRYYGYLGGLTNWHQPHFLHEDNHVVELDEYPEDYFFADDITDRALSMIRAAKTADPDKPFFLYLAHGAVHAPLHARPDDLEAQRGRYDAGWDVTRVRRHARQIELGVIDADVCLPPRNSESDFDVPPWSDLSAKEQSFASRCMEVYAAMVANVDTNLGRLTNLLVELGELENTVIVLSSDNGASWGGGTVGTTAYLRTGYGGTSGRPIDERELGRTHMIGGPRTMTHYARGWAMVSNTPFRLYKTTTYAGGHQVPLIVSWPRGFNAQEEIRTQYAYVSDVLPTLIELLDLDVPHERNGRSVAPMTGMSFASTLSDGDAVSQHTEQYFEVRGHRGYYRRGWEIVAFHYAGEPLEQPGWELYNVADDPTEIVELARSQPELVDELAAAWDDAAWANSVYPLGDGASGLYLLKPAGAGALDRAVALTPAHHTLEPNLSKALIRDRSFGIAIRIDYREGDQGILVAHGDQGGGYALYIEESRLYFVFNDSLSLASLDAGKIVDGTREVALDARAHDDGRWDALARVDGVERGCLAGLPAWSGHTPLEGIDVGIDRRSPVSWEIYERHGTFRYTGELHNVTYVPGELTPAGRAARSAIHLGSDVSSLKTS